MPALAVVLDEVRTASLFTPRKLVLVKGADALLAATSSEDREAALTTLLDFSRQPAADTRLVLELKKFDKRTSLARLLSEAGCLQECPRLYAARFSDPNVSMASTLGQHLTELARERALRLDEQAGVMLLELARESTSYLAAQLDKLNDYLGPDRRQVTAADVEIMASSGTLGAGDVVQKALAGQAAAALKGAERLFAYGMDSFGRMSWDDSGIALAIIATAFRKLQDIEQTDAGGSGGRPQRNRPAREAQAASAARRRLAGAGIEGAFRMLLEAELEIKTGGGRSPRSLTQEILIRLAGTAAGP
jgi:DNA polymerase III delta subunit